jgi:glycosyltransferase involved in cell wall biosynthesis
VNKISPEIHIVIPCYNGEKTITQVIRGIHDNVPEAKTIVIDDGSKDKTSEKVVAENAILLKHSTNLGQWAALRTGFLFSLMTGAEIIVTMDSDGQHSPEHLPDLLEPIIRGKTDVVVGSRFLVNTEVSMKAYRKYGIKLFNRLLKYVTGINLSDCTSGYKVYRSQVIKNILPELKENQYGALESLYYISRNKYNITEKKITNIKSIKSYKGNINYGYNLLRVIVNVSLL